MLAIDHPQGMEKIREWNAQDIHLLPKSLPFDFFFFQAHWPDWIQKNLDPQHHIQSYKPFLDEVKKDSPHLRVGMTTDSGSNENMIRSLPWIQILYHSATSRGFSSVGIYEYSISKFIYEEQPVIIELNPDFEKHELEIVFSKRMDPRSVMRNENYIFNENTYPSDIRFDGGNIVTLTMPEINPKSVNRLTIRYIRDDSNTFWFNHQSGKSGNTLRYPANSVDSTRRYSFHRN